MLIADASVHPLILSSCHPVTSAISSSLVVVFQLRIVMRLYSGAAMMRLSRLLVRCALRRCE